MSDFIAGFSARQNAAAAALQQTFAPPGAFAPTGMAGLGIDLGSGPVSFRPRTPMPGGAAMGAGAAPGSGRADPMASQPQHFHPANRDHDPTEGWDPFAACGSPSEPAIDPVEAARVAAHAEGYAQGLADAAEQARLHAEARERDGHLVDSIGQALASRVDRDAIAEHLRQTVLKLVSKLVGEIGVDPALLAGRIEAATDLLVDTQESAILRVHPDDVALLDGHLPETVFAVGDAAVARGSFVLESASTIVEDGPALWLDQLAAAIDKVPVPTC